MKVHVDSGRTFANLERYEDLLMARAMPDYRFVARDVIECDPLHLAELGVIDAGRLKTVPALAAHLFEDQSWVVERAFQRERFAAFMLTGLGKTAVQLEWARLVAQETGGRVLIVAPLNVVAQTIGEAERFYGASGDLYVADLTSRDVLDGWLAVKEPVASVGITNYEKLDGVTDRLDVAGVVLDESSMLRSIGGARKWAVMHAFAGVRFKLCCSATPAPNDRTEYAQHAVFLDQVRATKEYLTAYFRNDGKGNWDFKTHAYDAWVANLASWAVFMLDPGRWGFPPRPDMPELVTEFPQVPLTGEQLRWSGRYNSSDQVSMFGAQPGGIVSRTKLQQVANGFEYQGDDDIVVIPSKKPGVIVDLVADKHSDEQCIVWVTFDFEGDQLVQLIPGAVHLSGKTPIKQRTAVIEAFRRGEGPRVLILKPAMFSQGLNLQACTVQIFSSVHDSFERYFQCVRRSYRFGQTRPVHVYVPLTPLCEAINQNVMAKQATFQADSRALEDAVIARLRPQDTSEVRIVDTAPKTEVDRTEGDTWTLVHGDSIAHMPTMPAASVDLAIFSPPFAALYAYSKELGDMGNVRDDQEFRFQWRCFAEALLPVVKPGRVVAIHCADVPVFKMNTAQAWGHLADFPSDLREGMENAGFVFTSRITIDKDPQAQAIRTKAQALLFTQFKKNSLMSRPALGDYLIVFKAPGEAEVPVKPDVSNEDWIRWARPCWYDIRESDTLNTAVARETPDERHVCPLQLGLIERVVRLWSNPGELVFSPFAGIGSEGWEALAWGRRFYGVELKESYYRTACRNLAKREAETAGRISLLDDGAVA